MRRSLTTRTEDAGAVAVIVAILMTVFIGFTALVVDVGYWYNVKRQLQTAADSAALAGCQELKITNDAAKAMDVAIDYAEQRNAVPPGDGLRVYAAESEVGADFVKVTVRKEAPVFFSGIFGGADGYIWAQAKAELQWIAGMPGVVPLFLPIVGANQCVRARVGSGEWHDLDKDGNGVWRLAGLRVGGARRSTGYPIQIGIAAGRGQTPLFVIDDAARVLVRPTDSPIADVALDPGWVTGYPDGSAVPGQVRLIISATVEPSEVSIANAKVTTLTKLSATQWAATFAASGTSREWESWTAGVTFGTGNKKTSLGSIATLVSRRTTCPIANVAVSPTVVESPDALVSVTVDLNDFRKGEWYQLKVNDGEGVIGGLTAVDLNSLHHPDGEAPDPGGSHGGKAYGDYLAEGFPYAIHIGDTVETLPGGKSGPTTEIGVRMGDEVDYSDWVAAGRPMTSPRIVYLPIVEFADAAKERRTFRIVGFSAFYLDGDPPHGGNIVVGGYFIDYVGPGTVLDPNKPPVFGVQAPRLVGTDF